MQETHRKNGLEYVRRNGAKHLRQHVDPSNLRRGPLNNKWRGGITPQIMRIRTSPEMRAWRLAVFQRDNYTCQACGERGGDKHADHIKPFALYPELRFDVGNGRTLCVPCHRKHGAKVNGGRLIKPPTGFRCTSVQAQSA